MDNWAKRKIVEQNELAGYMATWDVKPNKNRDNGFELPSIYNAILTSWDLEEYTLTIIL